MSTPDQPGGRLTVQSMNLARFSPIFLAILLVPVHADNSAPAGDDLYNGWLKMYDLQFDEAHQIIGRWKAAHPQDALGPVSQAGGYLFSEFARLGVLESELFVDDKVFTHRKRVQPDAEAKRLFMQEIGAADQLADDTLQKSPNDRDALFAKSLALGLRADYASMVEKQNIASLNYTKQSRIFAERLLQVDSSAYDAYLAPGVENYLLSLKALPIRFVLQLTGAKVDREKGIEQLKMTAAKGHYLEPFAKLLLAVAALRDKDNGRAQSLLQELHDRFPQNSLYLRELSRLIAGTR